MKSTKLNPKRYTKERTSGSRKEVYDTQSGQWVSVTMAMAMAMMAALSASNDTRCYGGSSSDCSCDSASSDSGGCDF
jgi:hypothetical protein